MMKKKRQDTAVALKYRPKSDSAPKITAKGKGKLAALTYVVSSADGRPTDQSYKVFEYLKDQVDEQIQKLKDIIRTEVAAFNDLIESAGIAAVQVIKE